MGPTPLISLRSSATALAPSGKRLGLGALACCSRLAQRLFSWQRVCLAAFFAFGFSSAFGSASYFHSPLRAARSASPGNGVEDFDLGRSSCGRRRRRSRSYRFCNGFRAASSGFAAMEALTLRRPLAAVCIMIQLRSAPAIDKHNDAHKHALHKRPTAQHHQQHRCQNAAQQRDQPAAHGAADHSELRSCP